MKVDEPIIYETQYSDSNAKQINDEIRQTYSDKADQEYLIDYPTVYIIDQPGKQSKYRHDYIVYVGETIDIQRRTLEHLNGDAERRTDWQGLKNANNAHMFVNPILILIPCHRVIGADGSLTGYAAGLAAKKLLLDLEKGGTKK
ncbi:methylated-DNA--[protein]-cysteine S-methyltransferase [Lactobacillus delbrueckii subsp. bulgaricus]